MRSRPAWFCVHCFEDRRWGELVACNATHKIIESEEPEIYFGCQHCSDWAVDPDDLTDYEDWTEEEAEDE